METLEQVCAELELLRSAIRKNGRRPRLPLDPQEALAFFWALVDRPAGADACWTWRGTINTEEGYGLFYVNGENFLAHRWAYATLVGPIPKRLQIDHLCRERACVRPAHLEAVSQRENLLRGDTITAHNASKTHCVNGHAFTEENTRVRPNSRGGRTLIRVCRTCERAR